MDIIIGAKPDNAKKEILLIQYITNTAITHGGRYLPRYCAKDGNSSLPENSTNGTALVKKLHIQAVSMTAITYP